MGKMYTLDQKLLTDTPEIRIGDKVYPVDNRKKTMDKVSKLNAAEVDAESEIFKIALGPKAAKEIDAMDLPFPAHIALLELTIAAITGEEPEAVAERFQEAAEVTGTKLV